ncbi:MAG: Chemotaxis regulator - transmits chemoreceptor signals to flagelllar motor component CheY [Myxococcaceae bacterium]|nr:Chemotaxis regulator - transmits chemoreceptor signals to flagelllar motor component CheY [Myxococcaceae bacterium]
MTAAKSPLVRLLLVDDLQENLLALEALVRGPDIQVLQARSGTEALELLLSHDVALALIDVQMPEMDGFELAELMRGSDRTRRVPIIFVTAGAREPSRIFQGYDAGAVDFLFKPIDPHILRHKVDTFVELYRQRQQLAAQVETIRASEELRRRIMESNQDLIAMVDLEGRLLSVSRKGQELLGRSHSAPTSSSTSHSRWGSLWQKSAEAEQCLQRAMHGEPAGFQSKGAALDFGNRTWDVVVSPMRDARGRVERLLGVARDVSELQRLNEELSATLRLNETFVAAVGHDLRSPLNNVVLSAELLLESATSDRRVVERLKSSAERMSKMIDELFDLARARLSGGIPVQLRDEVDLAPVAEKIVGELAPGASSRSLELLVQGDTHSRLDPDRLGQVLANLLGNAIRHGTADTPVRLELDGTEPGQLAVSVTNHGTIPDDVLSCLFEPFRRGNSRTGNLEGLGLGLFIVQQIVFAHEGTISAESNDGLTTFRVVLPRNVSLVMQPPAGAQDFHPQ